ncbi:hypothetical protein LTR10_017747 [Elasticomyces elasticus]|uniref:Uncharacterized protein n=1 Tax=Exophiala sideris TaxID=1016849 RepID=A0ABR0JC30_9EURO|nr:hypothetical protein LTR10_017747 [Elasticomyces elasticus]KAK5031255.1 hypothetical protein LTS07_004990 [Exophiala sideris]KAK5038975.1 hypothetical protein LTR13_004006 [Exophiala sideris]KAK5060860.1 hypothetical protein LTR69_005459 [Exophiala sideris]KAK5183771.1 hypothetical protein LTR44_004053 [Eurotiomycetes sp. CCFEE 6388]
MTEQQREMVKQRDKRLKAFIKYRDEWVARRAKDSRKRAEQNIELAKDVRKRFLQNLEKA